jgi:hypothetical protein
MWRALPAPLAENGLDVCFTEVLNPRAKSVPKRAPRNSRDLSSASGFELSCNEVVAGLPDNAQTMQFTILLPAQAANSARCERKLPLYPANAQQARQQNAGQAAPCHSRVMGAGRTIIELP